MKNLELRKLNNFDFDEFVKIFNIYQKKVFTKEEENKFKNELFSKCSKINIFISVYNNKIVWFILVLKSYSTYELKETLHLEDFFILEEYRNKWIWRKLFNYLQGYWKQEGYSRITWVTRKNNEKAQKLYNKYETDHNRIYYKMKI